MMFRGVGAAIGRPPQNDMHLLCGTAHIKVNWLAALAN